MSLKRDLINNWKVQPVNLLLIFLIVLIYLWEVLIQHNFTIDVQTLFKLGAEYTPAIVQYGQWWRLITAGFLHVNITHILFNLVVMYFIGKLLEWQIGHVRYFILFMVAVISGNVWSMALGDLNGVSAGASGGIYGLFGAVIAIGILDRYHDFWKRESQLIGFVVAMSIIFAIFQSGVDIWAHIGGGVAGLVMAPMLIQKESKTGLFKIPKLLKGFSLIALIGFIVFGLWLSIGRV